MFKRIFITMLIAVCFAGCGVNRNQSDKAVDSSGKDAFIVSVANTTHADFSYIRCDYFLGDEQLGYIYGCPDEGAEQTEFSFDSSAFNDGAITDLSLFRIDVYLSYSDYSGEEALMQAMQGNTGRYELIGSVSFTPEYGNTYSYDIVSDGQNGYSLSPVSLP